MTIELTDTPGPCSIVLYCLIYTIMISEYFDSGFVDNPYRVGIWQVSESAELIYIKYIKLVTERYP